MKININKLLLFFMVAICTIDLPAAIIVYGTQIIGLIVVAVLILIKVQKISLTAVTIWAGFTILFVMITYVQSISIEHVSLIWKFAGRVIFWFFIFSLITPFFQELNRRDVVSILQTWIIIFSLFLYAQFLLYYVFGYVVDYSVILGGEPSRILNNVGLRASGLTSEPSIYSGMMISLLILHYIYNGQKNNFYTLFGGVSILLTFSTLGFFLFTLYLSITLLRHMSIKKIILLIGTITSVVVLIMPLLISRYERFINGDDVSNNVKFSVVENLLNNTSLFTLGYGVVGYSDGAPDYYQALYDLTLFGNLFVIFGIPLGIFTSVYIFLLLLKIDLPLSIKALILLGVVKISIPNYIFFYLFVLMVVFYKRVLSNENYRFFN